MIHHIWELLGAGGAIVSRVSASDTDEILLRQAAAGDEEAFTKLYRGRQPGIYRFALHMSGSGSVAEEVTQEVFLTLVRGMGRFDASRGSVSSYLFGIARNLVLRSRERDRGHVEIEEEGENAPLANDVNPLANLTRTEAIEAVRRAVLSLPENYREAVILCDLEEMSYADAASALGVPVGTVRSRLSRGRTMLMDKVSSLGCSV